jgi:hypothetical protein
VRLSDLPPAAVPAFRDAFTAPGAARRVLEKDGRLLALLEAREPVLVDPLRLSDLRFEGNVASIPGTPGRLVFRLRGERVPVRVRAPSGNVTRSTLTVATVGVGSLQARVDGDAAPGSIVEDPRDERVIGQIVAR